LKRLEVGLAWFFLIGCIIGWPVSQLTVAKHEPPFTLGLSWLAAVISAVQWLKSCRIHIDQDDDG
jgi:uncharacterized membrane protein YfcA